MFSYCFIAQRKGLGGLAFANGSIRASKNDW